MNIKQWLMVGLVPVILSGCANYISASQYSMVDPDVNYSMNENIVVAVADKSDIQSKYYVKPTIEALHKRGFLNVFSESDVKSQAVEVDVEAFVSVNKRSQTYQYTSDDYGMVETGTTHTKCNASGTKCTTTKDKKFGVTGSSTKTGIHTITTYKLNFWNADDRRQELLTEGSTYNNVCDTQFLYQFLAEQTIARLDLNKPIDYKYTFELPSGTKCR
ncbi:hypothetical protein [Vibrio rarus]|uniref:hypothetical protein n=1 Tax=Vibrio rarus TaxID=413403 RepID=UPI0021C4A698|nr:hypothetical protein [Vibrio rarus]